MRSQNRGAVCGSLSRDYQEQNARGNQPSEDVIQKRRFQSFPLVFRNAPVVGWVRISQSERFDRAVCLEAIALNALGQVQCSLLGPVSIKLNAEAPRLRTPGDGCECRPVSDTGIEGCERS